jgi:hypothetical protein
MRGGVEMNRWRDNPLVIVSAIGLASCLFTLVGCPPADSSTTDTADGLGRYDAEAKAIQIPFQALVLVRDDSQHGAFRLSSAVRWEGADDAVEYEYWFQPDGSGDFSADGVQHGTGVVFEKYRRTQAETRGWELTDQGGELNIKVGALWVEWSLGNVGHR